MKSFEILRKNSEPPKWDDMGVPGEARKAFAISMCGWIESDAHGFWNEPESRDGHCDPEKFAISIASRLSALSDFYNGNSTQSPIEDMMAGALLWVYQDWAGFPQADYLSGPADHKEVHGPSEQLEYYLTSQAPIAGYRVDFLLWFALKNHVAGVAIECDGHDFHEKTKEQAAADKKRDRQILAAGFPVMRFSGSEIFRDALGCAQQVSGVLSESLHRVSKDGGLY